MPKVLSKRELQLHVAGVYLIASRSGKHYIGASKQLRVRWRQHINRLSRGAHPYQKELRGALSFFVLQKFSPDLAKEHILKLEQKWAVKFPQRINKFRELYGKGHPVTNSVREKIRSANKGNPKLVGRRHTEEAKRAIAAGKRGHKIWLGRKHKPETIIQMRATRLRLIKEGRV